MDPHKILWLLAVVSFALGAGNLPGINWLCLGLMFAALTMLV